MTKRETLDAAAIHAGCLGRSQEDEPVFVLCARDPLASKLVREWALRYEEACLQQGDYRGRAIAKVDEALALSKQMDAWRSRAEAGR